MMKRSFSVALVVTLAALPHSYGAPDVNATNSSFPAVSGNSVIARGKGFEIKRRAMDQVLANSKVNDPHHQLAVDAELHVVAHLIEMQLVLQKATEVEKAEGRRQTDADLPNIVKTMGESEFERQLKETLMTKDDLRAMLSEEETAQTSLTRQLGIHITDAEAKKYFDDNPGVFDEPEKVRIRELMLLTTSDFTTSGAPPLPAATIQAKRQQIFDLHKRVCAGEDLVALAKQYNEDIISKGTGEIEFKAGQAEYADRAFSMKPGQISEVITNDDGFVFFQLLEIIPAQKGEFAALTGKIKRMLVGSQKQMLAPAYIKKLRKEAEIEILDPKLKTEIAAFEAQAAENAKAQAIFNAAHAEGPNSPTEKP